MPIPSKNKSEKKSDFMQRCMSDEVMKKEFPDVKQRYAVCQTKWDDKGKSSGECEEDHKQ